MRVVVRRVEAGVSAAAALLAASERTTLLFDFEAGALCHRVIGGDALRRGSTIAIAFTDRRADHLVGRSGLDLRIGRAMVEGHAAPSPICGQLTYEVACGSSFDGETFAAEAPLTRDEGRAVHEGTLFIPKNASRLLVYARVQAIAIARYSGFERVTEAWYADDQRIVLADRYDNPGGAFSNYDIPIR